MLEVESGMQPDRWIEVADIPRPVFAQGTAISVKGPDGKVYASVLAASQAVGIKYAAIRRLVDGRRDGWGRT